MPESKPSVAAQPPVVTPLEAIRGRALVGIPGAFVEDVDECLPIDGDEWGYVLSQSEAEALFALVDAARDFVGTTTVFRLRKESRNEFTDFALALAALTTRHGRAVPPEGSDRD